MFIDDLQHFYRNTLRKTRWNARKISQRAGEMGASLPCTGKSGILPLLFQTFLFLIQRNKETDPFLVNNALHLIRKNGRRRILRCYFEILFFRAAKNCNSEALKGLRPNKESSFQLLKLRSGTASTAQDYSLRYCVSARVFYFCCENVWDCNGGYHALFLFAVLISFILKLRVSQPRIGIGSRCSSSIMSMTFLPRFKTLAGQ